MKNNSLNAYYLIHNSAGYIFELLVCNIYFQIYENTW